MVGPAAGRMLPTTSIGGSSCAVVSESTVSGCWAEALPAPARNAAAATRHVSLIGGIPRRVANWCVSGAGTHRRPLRGGGIRPTLINGSHHDPIGWHSDDDQRVVVGAAAIEVEATVLGRDERLSGTRTHGGLAAAIEADDVTLGKRPGPIAVFIHAEPVNPGITLGEQDYAVVGLAAAIEIVAAAIDDHSRRVKEQKRGAGRQHQRRRDSQECGTEAPRRNVTLRPFAMTQPPQQLRTKRCPRLEAHPAQCAVEFLELGREIEVVGHSCITSRRRFRTLQSLVRTFPSLMPRISAVSPVSIPLP